MYNLGFCYERGDGVPQSDELAAQWITKAAEAGSANAQQHLGVLYEEGRGVAQSDSEAVKWYRKAALQVG
jgi:hypothetical protein